MTKDIKRINYLIDTLNKASEAYYNSEPAISDYEWDKMYDALVRMERETGVTLPDSPTHRVGGEPLSTFDQHRHIARLWSMDKAQSIEAVRAWAARAEKLRQEANEALAAEVKARAADTLDKVLFELSSNMKNAYSRSDM